MSLTDFTYTGTALPLLNTTVNLFSTTIAFPMAKGLAKMGIARIVVDLQNSHSGTLKAYQSKDRGVNWFQVIPDQAVAASAANDVNINDYAVEQYDDWKLDFANGGTTQTTFRVNVVGTHERSVAT